MEITVARTFFWEHIWATLQEETDADPEESALLHLFLIRRRRDIGFAAHVATEAFSDEAAKTKFREALSRALAEETPDLTGKDRTDYFWHRYIERLEEGDLRGARLIETVLAAGVGTDDGYLAPPVPAGTSPGVRSWTQQEKAIVTRLARWSDLYFEAPFFTDFPATQIIPAELETASFTFVTLGELLGGAIPPGSAESFEKFVENAAASIALFWFTGMKREEQIALLNTAYPFSIEEETLDAFVDLFDDYETLLEDATDLVRRGFGEEARTVYAYIILHARNPIHRHAAYTNLAVLFREEHESGRAVECAERALAVLEAEADPDPYRLGLARKDVGETNFLDGNIEKAETAIASAIRTAEDLAPAQAAPLLWAVASSLRRTGQFEDEYAVLTGILDLEVTGEAMDAAMERLFSMDQYARPDGTFDRKGLLDVERRRRYLDHFGKGAALLQTFQFDRAIACFEAALALSRDTDLLRNTGIAHRLYGSPTKARALLEEVLEACPDDLYARVHLGLLIGGDEGRDLISAAMEEAVGQGADLALVLYPVVQHAAARPEDGIIAEIERYADLPAQEGKRSLFYLGAGTALADLGFKKEANTCYRRALKANPPAAVRARVLRNMGVLAAEQGEDERAAALLGQAIQAAPEDPTIWHRLARVRAALGDPDGAADAAREAARLAPTDESYQQEKALKAAKNEVPPPSLEDTIASELIDAGERLIEHQAGVPTALRAYAAAAARLGLDPGEPIGEGDALSERARLFTLIRGA
ncbi:tetratricopeptide repeat protein [Methanofollis formosanus]|uniref:Tetratricopeptide repeat protein n=1 Tax=Methanofollis formosanus TaxID=299308 RepID=A0A8G1A3H3_9EURY|nr:tetratricopeptide repeat protein [Methanofollis formosanus]QYZ79407.1 tetratricopeptide repeat protein [Methanofollis formosanus]